jgi:poly-gamma-glutamate synthesis protein (capsule biosynthesis protein)
LKLKKPAGLLLFWVYILAMGSLFASQVQKETINLAFVGDVMLARNVGKKIMSFGTSYPFAKTKDILAAADIAFANLEGVLSGTKVTGSSRAFIFCSPPYFGESLKNGGIDIVSLANNHSTDGGTKGLLEMLKTLSRLGIKYVGAGKNSLEARSLRIIETKGRKIGFLAYTDLSNIGLAAATATSRRAGVASARSTNLFSEIESAKKAVDFLIVSFHWGTEYQLGEPGARQKKLAYQCIDKGADVIIGHHPHVLQKIEIYHGKTIAYSLGNFVFDNHRPSRAKTMILQLQWNPAFNKQSISVIPCYIRSCRPLPLTISPSKNNQN